MTEVWIQPSLFPEFPTDFWAYEMEAVGGRWFEVYDDSSEMIASIEPDDFGDFLEFARSINYNVFVNTLESWEALMI
jgi:hypothetical protein